ncbi:ion transporter [Phreatobacter sp.]|uniref:ion transporter n=1 Tax=Phreatobacter sp. TaxID=1966341 RepID=UPI003F7027DD
MIAALSKLIEAPLFERTIIALIIVNAVILGLETSASVRDAYGDALAALDRVILAVFVAEIAARLAVRGWRFFRDPWSLFDLFVVGIALVPATGSLSVLRALRVLRILRLITVVLSLRRVVGGLFGALPGMASIGLLLFLIFYVFAVIVTKLYGEALPERFGSLGASAFTLFQAMTFDDWSASIVKPLTDAGFMSGWVVIIVFMVLSGLVALNLFIGVVVTALDTVAQDEKRLSGKETADPVEPAALGDEVIRRLDTMAQEIGALRAEVARLGGARS